MNITILNKDISTQPAKKLGGKPYQLVEVAYKNNTFGGAVQGKKITSYSKAFQAVSEANIGGTYEVATEKNGEFVEWTALSAVSPSTMSQMPASVSVAPPGQVSRGAVSGTPVRSTYETSEERAAKQVFIIRQSSVSSAIAALSVGGKSKLSANEVVELAKQFESYVLSTGKFPSATGFDDIPALDPSFDTNPQID